MSRSGDSSVWLAGSALALCLLMTAALVGVVAYRGLGSFWPGALVEVRLREGSRLMGQVVGRQEIPGSRGRRRLQFKVGNREVYGLDFRWVDEARILARRRPPEAAVIERLEWGDMYGFVRAVYAGDELLAAGGAAWEKARQLRRALRPLGKRLESLEKDELGRLDRRLEVLRLERRGLERQGGDSRRLEEIAAAQRPLRARYERATQKLERLRRDHRRYSLAVELAGGGRQRVNLADIVRLYRPNLLSGAGRARLYLSKLWEFVAGQPRESNTEGGVFPALFGTVMMVVLMSIAGVPFGVLAALYLSEYARRGPLVSAIRIAVNNLAGVPSIVYGMFGLGFFVYGVGGTLDRLFYPEALPAPTFGTGGILWASLTLALLTVPVVVAATEEGLAAVPGEVRLGSLALGSTRLQMIWRVVLPGALPGILTGLVLATARGAGEVAPLMITGVVKLAPALPLDAQWPFFHLERKFMHLGFYIYDAGFQSPNAEAAQPMVFATTFLLLLVILLLNLSALVVRNRLRRRYGLSVF